MMTTRPRYVEGAYKAVAGLAAHREGEGDAEPVAGAPASDHGHAH